MLSINGESLSTKWGVSNSGINEENSFTKPEKDNKVKNDDTREHKQVGTRLSSGNTLVSLAQASVHKKSLGSNLPHPRIKEKDDLKLTKDALKTAIEEEDSDKKEDIKVLEHKSIV